ncbi:hypothetical protein RND71_012681 [Anisodus tanguticus]|uniref:Toll-like receptor 3 n=1 Tax=Anisodus tanguticus TaxID=243964 RepID=A0AAE1VQ22_9SOLA|nr:hypothetical protein RND71_012681 [Anisodus tanguticus]
MLTGNISSSLVKLQYLKYLDLSSNNFGGEKPKFISYLKRLEYLNLSAEASLNGFTGLILPQLQNLTYLRALDLGGNSFTVKSLEWLSHLVYLEYLDLSLSDMQEKNWLQEIIKLTNLRELHLSVIRLSSCNLGPHFPKWLQTQNNYSDLDVSLAGTELAGLGILSLQFKEFSGSIPPSICQLQSIQLLDLSGNHLSGRIPQCFGNFTTLQLLKDGSSVGYDFNPYVSRGAIVYHGNALVQWKNKESEYHNTLWLLKTIDLSSNELVGDIPEDLSRMNTLLSLNLSRNNLTGNIIEGIGLMKMLECLDLSGINSRGRSQ